MDKQQRFSRYQSMGISLGMCFGVSIGLAFGSMLFDKSTTGMCFGLPIGMMLGLQKAREDVHRNVARHCNRKGKG